MCVRAHRLRARCAKDLCKLLWVCTVCQSAWWCSCKPSCARAGLVHASVAVRCCSCTPVCVPPLCTSCTWLCCTLTRWGGATCARSHVRAPPSCVLSWGCGVASCTCVCDGCTPTWWCNAPCARLCARLARGCWHQCTPCLGMLTPVHAHTSLVHVHEPCARPRAPRCLQPPPCAPPGCQHPPCPPCPRRTASPSSAPQGTTPRSPRPCECVGGILGLNRGILGLGGDFRGGASCAHPMSPPPGASASSTRWPSRPSSCSRS